MPKTRRPDCRHCYVYKVCFMPKQIAQFQNNFTTIIPRSAGKLSFTVVIGQFREFIASHCQFYKERE